MRNWGALVADGGRRQAVEVRAVELWRREYGATAGACRCEETESASAKRDGAGFVFCIGILFRWGRSRCFQNNRARASKARAGAAANPEDLSPWIRFGKDLTADLEQSELNQRFMFGLRC